MTQLIMEAGHGGTTNAPEMIDSVSELRFKMTDNSAVDTEGFIYRPTAGAIFTCEKWIRLRALTVDGTLSNLQFYRSGPRLRGIEEYYFTTGTYEPGIVTNRFAHTVVPEDPLILDVDINSPGQIGPWFVLQWKVFPNALAGPQGAMTYHITVDETP